MISVMLQFVISILILASSIFCVKYCWKKQRKSIIWLMIFLCSPSVVIFYASFLNMTFSSGGLHEIFASDMSRDIWFSFWIGALGAIASFAISLVAIYQTYILDKENQRLNKLIEETVSGLMKNDLEYESVTVELLENPTEGIAQYYIGEEDVEKYILVSIAVANESVHRELKYRLSDRIIWELNNTNWNLVRFSLEREKNEKEKLAERYKPLEQDSEKYKIEYIIRCRNKEFFRSMSQTVFYPCQKKSIYKHAAMKFEKCNDVIGESEKAYENDHICRISEVVFQITPEWKNDSPVLVINKY